MAKSEFIFDVKSMQEKIERGLSATHAEETSYRRHDHRSGWLDDNTPETRGELMGRWDVTISECKLTEEWFQNLKSEYLKKMSDGAKKDGLIQRELNKYAKKYNLAEAGTGEQSGYRKKGYIWFEDGANFSLKDFVVRHPETIDLKVYDTEIAAPIDHRCIEDYIEQGPKNERKFLFACEGYADAKYVDFLKGELSSQPVPLNVPVQNTTNEDKKKSQATKLTHLLELYYQKGCKPLTKVQVNKLAIDKGVAEATLTNRWINLKRDSYQHNGNPLNVKEFLKSYEELMNMFTADRDNRAFNDVKNHYEQLKETYSDLIF